MIFNFRAINEQSLVGNIGGYLGLFMGYSILQLPILIHAILKKLEYWYLHFKSVVYPNEHLSLQINVKEASPNIGDEPLRMSQFNNFVENHKSTTSKLDDKIEVIQERLLKLETTIRESLLIKLST